MAEAVTKLAAVSLFKPQHVHLYGKLVGFYSLGWFWWRGKKLEETLTCMWALWGFLCVSSFHVAEYSWRCLAQ